MKPRLLLRDILDPLLHGRCEYNYFHCNLLVKQTTVRQLSRLLLQHVVLEGLASTCLQSKAPFHRQVLN